MTSLPANLPEKAPEVDLRILLEAGAHFGHQKAKWSPKMKEWIYMEKDGVHIIDLEKTAAQLQKAYNFAFYLGQKGKTMIVLGTKRQAREHIETSAKAHGLYYITSRWLGGLLTNWPQVKKSLQRMLTIEDGLKTDKYKGYTKYERLRLEKEMGRLERFFVGIKSLKEAPDALFIVDPVREKNAVLEAVKCHVPVMAVCDTNADPDDISLVIPANDDAQKSIEFVVEYVTAGYEAGKKSGTKK